MIDILVLLWLGDVATAVCTLLVLGSIATIIAMITVFVAQDGDFDNRPLAKKIFVCCLVTLLIACLLPSKQWFYIAAGGTAVTKTLDSELSQKVMKMVEQKIDEELSEESE